MSSVNRAADERAMNARLHLRDGFRIAVFRPGECDTHEFRFDAIYEINCSARLRRLLICCALSRCPVSAVQLWMTPLSILPASAGEYIPALGKGRVTWNTGDRLRCGAMVRISSLRFSPKTRSFSVPRTRAPFGICVAGFVGRLRSIPRCRRTTGPGRRKAAVAAVSPARRSSQAPRCRRCWVAPRRRNRFVRASSAIAVRLACAGGIGASCGP